MSTEQDVPQWKRVADGIYGESFGHRSRKSVLEAAAAWDGQDEDGKALPGDFYLHHQGYLTLQALADVHRQGERTNHLLKRLGQELRGIREALEGDIEDAPTEEVPRSEEVADA